MIHLTENAATHISNYLKSRGKGEGIRVGVKLQAVLVLLMFLSLSTKSILMTRSLNSLVLKFS